MLPSYVRQAHERLLATLEVHTHVCREDWVQTEAQRKRTYNKQRYNRLLRGETKKTGRRGGANRCALVIKGCLYESHAAAKTHFHIGSSSLKQWIENGEAKEI